MFGECGVRFGLEVHPTEIAFDLYTAERALEAIGHREEFGFNFDPSHLLWQGVNPVDFIFSTRNLSCSTNRLPVPVVSWADLSWR